MLRGNIANVKKSSEHARYTRSYRHTISIISCLQGNQERTFAYSIVILLLYVHILEYKDTPFSAVLVEVQGVIRQQHHRTVRSAERRRTNRRDQRVWFHFPSTKIVKNRCFVSVIVFCVWFELFLNKECIDIELWHAFRHRQ